MAPAAQKDWFMMYGIPKVADENEMSKKFPNASFTFNEAPLLSHLTVPSNVAAPAGGVDYPCIAATDDFGLLLLCGYTFLGLTYYICDPYFRRTLGILPPDGGFSSRHNVGLILHRRRSGLMVATLNTGLFNTQARVTLSCTRDLCEWVDKEADCGHIRETKQWWCCDGVLSHNGFLWWFDLSSCMLACDPFLDTPPVYQIMFPHVPHPLQAAWFPVQGDKYRCLKVSKGRLRYVQIHGDPAVVSMWTLSSNDPSDAACWELKLRVRFTDIWSHPTYKSSMLPEIVPTVGLVHPMNANKVYFFLGHNVFCVNLKKKKLRQCLELNNQELPSLSSLVVHSWNLPAGTTKIHLLSGSDESHIPGIHFLAQYDSMDGFFEKAFDVMSRSHPELFGMGLDELEEDEDESVTMEESDDGDDSEIE